VKDFDEYQLWIDAYSPETIPMERLAAYLAAFAKLLGNETSVHFRRLDGGSTTPVALVEREAAPKVFARVERADRRDAANDERAAFKEINELARSDNAVATLFRVPQNGNKTTVLHFPGRETPAKSKFGPFNEPAVVVGELVRVGGKDASAHALLVDAEGKSWSAEIKKDMAQRMGPHLYNVLRVTGEARWERDEEGHWKLLNFKVIDFDPLPNEDLLDGVKKLRALRDSDWSKSSDIDGDFRAARGHEDGLH
jgi:hypothetical protein